MKTIIENTRGILCSKDLMQALNSREMVSFYWFYFYKHWKINIHSIIL